MSFEILQKRAKNQSGRILIFVLITVFILSAFWIIALTSTGTELHLVGGRKSAAQQFFDAEAGLESAMENFGALTSGFTSDLTTSVATETIKDPTSSADPATQRTVAEITVRPVQDLDPAVAQANGQPVQSHTSEPPPDLPPEQKCSVGDCEIRRYTINAVAGGRELQIGVYRVVPK